MNNVDQVEEILKDNLVKKTRSGGNPEKTLQKKFKSIDLNGDACLSFAEFKRAVEPYLIGTPDHLLQALFDKWDTDSSGGLDASEFIDGLFKSPQEREEMRKEKENQKKLAQSKSVKADDIIEQAKRNRAARMKAQNRGPERKPVRERLEQASAGHPVGHQAKKLSEPAEERKMVSGAFRGPWGESLPPYRIRYQVSSTWVNVHPPEGQSTSDLNKELKRSHNVPSSELELGFVYGINPKAGMHTVEKTGEIVYGAAGVGVVYNPRKHEQRFFLGHDDDITCIDLDPSQTHVATGCMGKSPVIHVWNIQTMEIIASTPVGYYDRQICAVAFSARDPNIFLGIGSDNHHMMAVWDSRSLCKAPLAQVATQNGAPPQIYKLVADDVDTTQHRFVTCGFKHTKFWVYDEENKKLTGGKNAVYGNITPTPRETRSAVFLPRSTAITGGSNGVIYIWDLEKKACRRAVPAHDGPILGLLVAADNELLSSGGKDRKISYWSTATATEGSGSMQKLDEIVLPEAYYSCAYSMGFISRGKGQAVLTCSTRSGSILAYDPLQADKPSKGWKVLTGGHACDLYGLATHPTNDDAFITVGEDKLFNVWDGESKQLIFTRVLPGQARSVDISSKFGGSSEKQAIAVGFKDGSFCVLDSTTFEIIFTAKHCEETIDDLRFSPDSSRLAVGSHDNFIDIYDVNNNFKHVARCSGHSSYITHIDWSSDSKYIQSNCGAYETLCWNAGTGRSITSCDAEWKTFTCILGYPVMGVWPHGADGTDINAVDRSPDHSLLVTGDDFGNVNLLNYPCLIETAPRHTYKGHSSHVMNIRWSASGKKVVSVGGHDKSVFQWHLKDAPDAFAKKAAGGAKASGNLFSHRKWKAGSSWK